MPPSRARRDVGRHGDPGELADRIRTLARVSFAANGWAGTSMRGIAREAGVDPALVHYYFDSKEALLASCMTPPLVFVRGVAAAAASPIAGRGQACVRVMLDAWGDPDTNTALRSVLLTAAHVPPALAILQRTLREVLVDVVSDHLDVDDRRMRAALVSSQMIGYAMMRYIWQVSPLPEMSDEQVIAFIAPNIQRYLDGEVTV